VAPTYRIPAVPPARLLDDAARDFPAAPALVTDTVDLDYRRLHDAVAHTEHALTSLGVGATVGEGARVGIVEGDRALTAVAVLAVFRAGAIVVPLAADGVAAAAAAAGCAVVMCPPAVVATLGPVRSPSGPVRHVIELAPVGRTRWARLRRRRAAPTAGALPSVLLRSGAARRSAHRPFAVVAQDAVAVIPSTDAPALTVANLVAAAFQMRLWIPDVSAGRERVLVDLPLADVAGIASGLLPTALAAGALVLTDGDDPAALAAAVARHRPTILIGRPGTFVALLEHRAARRRDLSSLRVCIAVGALDPGLRAGFEVLTGGARLRSAWAPSPHLPLTHAEPVYGRTVPRSVGLPLPDTAVVVVDDGELVDPGEVGEVVVAGPQLPHPGWTATGIRGHLDRAGYLMVED